MYIGGQNEDWEIPKVELPKVSCKVMDTCASNINHLQTIHLLFGLAMRGLMSCSQAVKVVLLNGVLSDCSAHQHMLSILTFLYHEHKPG